MEAVNWRAKKVCEIAHANGAFVYADIVQAAGVVPVGVRDSNVDFAACASYKWLMGDFGLGLLCAREDLLDRVKRTQYGYYQLTNLHTRRRIGLYKSACFPPVDNCVIRLDL
jgi:selenocysteine lyase/cysteine desulfurase